MVDTENNRRVAKQKIDLLRRWFHSQLSKIRERQRQFFVSTDQEETKKKVADVRDFIDRLK
ncbi:MAG: hypothetical protein HOE53_01945 [Candidatus Magasanikbacteria bacterium]|jgi:hypothetical protein|nr:hypothetical protein [Candidatus Magasanikbacteria bacterium]